MVETPRRARCPICGAELVDGTTDFVVEIDSATIAIHDVPAQTCPQCGDAVVTDQTAAWLEDEVAKRRRTRSNKVVDRSPVHPDTGLNIRAVPLPVSGDVHHGRVFLCPIDACSYGRLGEHMLLSPDQRMGLPQDWKSRPKWAAPEQQET